MAPPLHIADAFEHLRESVDLLAAGFSPAPELLMTDAQVRRRGGVIVVLGSR